MTKEVSASKASPVVALEFRSSPIHGTGAFAVGEIPAGARVIQYLGEKISKSESVRRCELNNEYIFCYDEDWDLDGNVPGNPARFINHSCAPNCESQLLDDQIWIVSLRPIPAGEEITFNYGYDIENFEEHPCGCAAPNCAGFILAEEFFETARRRVETDGWLSNVC